MDTYHATSYHRTAAPRTATFQAPAAAHPLELLRRAALALGIPKGKAVPTSHLAAARTPSARLIVHVNPAPPPDPFRMTAAQAHQAAARYRIAHQAHKDAMESNPGRAAALADATGDLHDAPRLITYRATYGPRSEPEHDRAGVTIDAPPAFTRRQLVQKAKRALHIKAPLRDTMEHTDPPRITSEAKGRILTIRPVIPLRPEDISDEEV